MKGSRHAVVGAGIVGLAIARSLAIRGADVTVFEGDAVPQGASVRNFGTLWPIGQPSGPRRNMAVKSLEIWREVIRETGAWSAPDGSLHLAYHDDELKVLEEFAAAANADGFACALLDASDTVARHDAVRRDGLKGSLWSEHEWQVNPRVVSRLIRQWLDERLGVRFELGTRVNACSGGEISAGRKRWPFDHVWIAPGAELQTLYPEVFAAMGLRRCKLQMMRTSPIGWHGPILAGGLTLTHYEGFAACPSLPVLKTSARARLANADRRRRSCPGVAP